MVNKITTEVGTYEFTDDKRFLRNGFIIGKIKWIEEGEYSRHAFVPEKDMNFDSVEMHFILENLNEIED